MKRIFVLGFVVNIAILGAYFMAPKAEQQTLPIINPIDVHSEMVDPELLRIGFGHKIGNFSFQNQEGITITEKNVKGKVFIVEFFFTTCGTICPRMNLQMQRVQNAFQENKDLKILSFTVNPEVDTVEQMKRYAVEHKAHSNQWYFLTGDKKKLYELARKSFFVLKPSESQNLGDAGSDFIHTNNFVLIDRKMRIRGYYDGTSAHEVNDLLKDIEILLEEK